MNNILAITKKEVQSYFNSPIAYIIIVLFLITTGWFFTNSLFLAGQASVRSILGFLPFILMFFIPPICMKQLAEEKKTGTLELLVTMPISDMQIVVGKFLASFSIVAISIIGMMIYAVTVSSLGSPDYGVLISSYLGLFFLGATYTAIGIYTSSITNNQIVAFILSFFILFILYMIGRVIVFIPSLFAPVFEFLSTDTHFGNITRGVIDSRDVLYYLSIIFISLWSAARALEKRKG